MSSRRRELVEIIRPLPSGGVRRAAVRLAVDLAVYAVCWTALLLPVGGGAWYGKAVLAAFAGLAIARLFLIGHDACHGAFFPSLRWANKLAGRLVFLPSLTPYSTWELGHNTLHHGFTNLRGKDYVYAPLSKAEFDALPSWRRLLERLYRHPLGPGIHYAVEVWWRRLWFPRPHAAQGGGEGRAIYQWDSALTLAFLATQIAIAWAAARATAQDPVQLAGWSVAAPFAVWNMVMGFVTYQQHTHPSVIWFADRREWDPVGAQVHGTVHVRFPALIGALLGNIMEHTAHHLDVAIPLFDLPEAQRRVENEFPGEVVMVDWRLSYYLDCCRRCKLFDYASRSWTDFAGYPTGFVPASSAGQTTAVTSGRISKGNQAVRSRPDCLAR